MIKKIKQYLLVAITAVMMFAPVALIPAAANADDITTDFCSGVTDSSGGTCDTNGTTGTSGIKNLATAVVKIFSYVVGVISIVMILYAAFRYITSGGDSGKVTAAKNALIYAIIGLVIVAAAQAIVHYVLSTGAKVGTSSSI